MALNSNALISIEKFKLLTNNDNPSNQEVERIEEFINHASATIERETKRKFISTEIDEIFDGNGKCRRLLLYRPIINIPTEIKYYDGSSQTYVALSSPVFGVNTDSGLIYFKDGNAFTKGNMNWQITYTYGYILNNIPADLALACAALAMFYKRIFDENLHNISNYSYGDESTSFSHTDKELILPPIVQTVINKYTSKRSGLRG